MQRTCLKPQWSVRIVLFVMLGMVALPVALLAQSPYPTSKQSLILVSPQGGGDKYISLKAPDAQISNYQLSLPTSLSATANQLMFIDGTTGQMNLLSPGTVGQILQLGGGGLSWISPLSLVSGVGWSLTGNASTSPLLNYLGTSDAQPLILKTNGSERLRILSGGNVGIGTATPAELLELKDGNILISNSGTAGELRFQEPNASGTNYTSLKAGAQSVNLSYTFPLVAPTAGQFLQSDATGAMSWVSIASVANGSVTNSTLRWNGTSWVENTNAQTAAGALTLGSNSNAASLILNDGQAISKTATISLANLAANRIYTIPDAGANASFVMTEGAQTINGSKTFGSAPTITPFSTAGIVKNSAAGLLSSGTVNLASTNEVSGVLPIANGGTNSSTALNNNRIMVSNGGSIVEAAALTNGQILVGSTGAAPTAATLTAGTGISITNGAGSITINASGAQLSNGTTTNSTLRWNGTNWVENTSLLATATGTETLGGNSQAGTLSISDGAVTMNTASIIAATQGANRIYTIPNAGANASFVMTEGAQTINGSKTFGSAPTITPFSTAGIVKNSAAGLLSSGTVNLASTNEVSGVLPVANGGTGVATITGVVVGNGTSAMVGRTLTGTANQISITNGDGTAGNPTFALANDAIFPGNGSNTIVSGTTLQRPGTPSNGMIRYNSTTNQFEFYQNGSWTNYASSTSGWSLNGNSGTTYSTNYLGTSDAIALAIKTSGTIRMKFDGGNSNIAIGSALDFTPAAALHIDNNSSANIKFSVQATTGNTASDGFDIGVTSGGVAEIRNRENTNMLFYTNNTQRMSVANSGEIGIGTVSAVSQLHQDRGNATASYHKFTAGTTTGQTATDGFDIGINSAGDAQIIQNENQPISFMTNGSANERMRITGAGNVGIGTTSPTTTLHVNGSGRISGGSLTIDTSAASTAGSLIFYNPARTFSTTLKAGAQTANLTYTFPTAAPTAGQVLSSDASGNLSWTTSTTGTVTGSGTATQVAFWSGASALSSSANLYWDNTNSRLGVGLNSPVSDIHIDKGTATASYLQFTANATTGQTATDGFRVGIDATGNGYLRQYENLPLYFYTNNALRMYIAGTGEIAVNKASISSGLQMDVSGSIGLSNTGTASELRLYEPSASGFNYTAFKAQTQAADVTYTLPAADGTNGQILSTNGSGTLSWTTAATGTVTGTGTATQVAFWSSASALSSSSNLYWDNTNSRLGLGITSPTSQLHLDGGTQTNTLTHYTMNATTGQTSSDGVDVGLKWNGTTTSGEAVLWSNEDYPLILGSNNNEVIRFQATGGTRRISVGGSNTTTVSATVHQDIGTSAATYHKFTAGTTTGRTTTDGLDIGINGAGDAQIIQNENQPISFMTNGAANERMRITGAGNVGIGTTSPTTTLHVNGSGRISGGSLTIDTSAASTAGSLIFYNPARTFSTTLKAGAQTANLTYTFPTAAPTAGQVLSSDASGNLSWTTATTGTVTGSGTATQVAFWSGASALSSSSNLYWDNTNSRLGIGTGATVSAPLHVVNTGTQMRLGYDATNYTAFTAMNNGNFGINPTGGATAITGSLSSSGALSVSSGGATITGNSSITGALTVSSHVSLTNSGTASEIRLYEPSAGGTDFTAFKAQTQAASVTYTLPAADGSNGQVLSTNGSGTLSWASAATGTVTGTGTATQVAYWSSASALTSSSNLYWDNTNTRLGIGTNSPSAASHNLTTDAATSTITVGEIIAHNSSGTPAAGFGTALKFTLKSSTTNDQDAAQINALWTTATHASRASALTFSTLTGAGSLTERLRIDGSGNVGIGTTSPTTTLHVNGSGRISGGSLTIDTSAASTAGTLVFYNPARTFTTSFKAGANAANVAYTLPAADGSNGQVLQTNGSATLSWATPSTSATSVPLSGLTAATALNSINSADFAQTWQWNSLSSNSALTLSSSSTAAASNTQTLLNIALSGANATASQTTYGMQVTNTHTGTTPTNVAGYFSASGATNNYGLLVAAGYVGVGTTSPATSVDVDGAVTVRPGAVSVTADNQAVTVGNRSYLRLTSNGTPGNRTITLSNGLSDGQILYIRVDGSGTAANGVEIADSGSCNLSGLAQLIDGAVIQLLWDNTSSKWFEVTRSNN